MKLFLCLTFFLVFTMKAQAALTVTDVNKLAIVTLHTEEMSTSKRVYLAADFEATLKSGLIFCALEVDHKRGKDSGKTKIIKKETTLMAGEKMPFNLGIFPNFFHASGLDVKAKLVCKKINFFEKKDKKLLIAPVGETCCQLGPFKVICVNTPGSQDVDIEEEIISQNPAPTFKYPDCYPNQ